MTEKYLAMRYQITQRGKSMRMTVRELMEKIDTINQVIDELYKMPDREACTRALKYLDEYVDMLKDIKVDV